MFEKQYFLRCTSQSFSILTFYLLYIGSKKLRFKIGETTLPKKNNLADNQNKITRSCTSYVSYSLSQINALVSKV